jgi:hypothetical protein
MVASVVRRRDAARAHLARKVAYRIRAATTRQFFRILSDVCRIFFQTWSLSFGTSTRNASCRTLALPPREIPLASGKPLGDAV